MIQCMMYDTGLIIWYDKFPPRLSERGGEIVYQYEYQLLESRCRCGSITLKRAQVMDFTHPEFYNICSFNVKKIDIYHDVQYDIKFDEKYDKWWIW